MRVGYYYKLNDKWHFSLSDRFVSAELPEVKRIYYYGCGYDRDFKNAISTDWQYSETKDPVEFVNWVYKSPSEEDLIILELMFP